MTPAFVSLVIPGRNCRQTIRPCLEAVVPLLSTPGSPLAEIIFVDDGSTDGTTEIVEQYPIRLVRGQGTGPGAARNLGWRSASGSVIWFIDSDCVAETDALARLLPHLDHPAVAGVSGSYGNMRPDSLLACLIHEEIVERHRRMGTWVDFLATFNVLYRRSVLEQVAGFDERFMKGQDAELSFRVQKAGHELRFEFASRVKHYHEARWRSYLRTQRQQGYWRVFLHLSHPGHTGGDSYSSFLDHVQPPLAMLSLAVLPLLAAPTWRWLAVVPPALLVLAPVSMTWRLLHRTKQPQYAAYWIMSLVRAFWRGAGLVQGLFSYPVFKHS